MKAKYYISCGTDGTRVSLDKLPVLKRYLLGRADELRMHTAAIKRGEKFKNRLLQVPYDTEPELKGMLYRYDGRKNAHSLPMIFWVFSVPICVLVQRKKIWYFECPSCHTNVRENEWQRPYREPHHDIVECPCGFMHTEVLLNHFYI